MAQKDIWSIFPQLPGHFPIPFDARIPKMPKKMEKVDVLSLPKSLFVYTIAAYYAIQPTLLNTKNNLPNVAQSTSDPSRNVVDIRKYDPRSLDHQNWSTGWEIIGFSIH